MLSQRSAFSVSFLCFLIPTISIDIMDLVYHEDMKIVNIQRLNLEKLVTFLTPLQVEFSRHPAQIVVYC